MSSREKKENPQSMGGWYVQICWSCAKACGGCSWSADFTPVKGWKAEPSIIYYNGNKIPSYKILECPQYKEDSRK